MSTDDQRLLSFPRGAKVRPWFLKNEYRVIEGLKSSLKTRSIKRHDDLVKGCFCASDAVEVMYLIFGMGREPAEQLGQLLVKHGYLTHCSGKKKKFRNKRMYFVWSSKKKPGANTLRNRRAPSVAAPTTSFGGVGEHEGDEVDNSFILLADKNAGKKSCRNSILQASAFHTGKTGGSPAQEEDGRLYKEEGATPDQLDTEMERRMQQEIGRLSGSQIVVTDAGGAKSGRVPEKMAYHVPYRCLMKNPKSRAKLPGLSGEAHIVGGPFERGETVALGKLLEDDDPDSPPIIQKSTKDDSCVMCSTTFLGWDSQSNQREGELICDYFTVLTASPESKHGVKAIFGLADGSGWGITAHQASKVASTIAVETVANKLETSNDPEKSMSYRSVCSILQQAVQTAHNKIISSVDTPFHKEPTGSTTLLLGVVCELEKPERSDPGDLEMDLGELKETFSSTIDNINSSIEGDNTKCSDAGVFRIVLEQMVNKAMVNFSEERFVDEYKHCFISVSVGDCKAFRRSSKTGTICEITHPTDHRDVRDAGGQLGWSWGEAKADTCWPLEAVDYDEGSPREELKEQIKHARDQKSSLHSANTHVSVVPLVPGDQLLMMTDGIYDNLLLTSQARSRDEKLLEIRLQRFLLAHAMDEDCEGEEWLGHLAHLAPEHLGRMTGDGDIPLLPAPAESVNWLVHYGFSITQGWRDHTNQVSELRKILNSSKKTSDHVKKYAKLQRIQQDSIPGKPDDATVIVYQVGALSN